MRELRWVLTLLLFVGVPGAARAESSADRIATQEFSASRTASAALLKVQQQERHEIAAAIGELEDRLTSLRAALLQSSESRSLQPLQDNDTSGPTTPQHPEQASSSIATDRDRVRSRLDAVAAARLDLEARIPSFKAPRGRLIAKRATEKLRTLESAVAALLEESLDAPDPVRVRSLAQRLRVQEIDGGSHPDGRQPSPSRRARRATRVPSLPSSDTLPGVP